MNMFHLDRMVGEQFNVISVETETLNLESFLHLLQKCSPFICNTLIPRREMKVKLYATKCSYFNFIQ